MPTTRRACRAALFQSIGDDVLTQAGVSCVRTRVNWTQRNERGLEILGIFEECGRLAVAIASSFGECTPIAKPSGIKGALEEGKLLSITGADFQ